jgi:hypothetical protein
VARNESSTDFHTFRAKVNFFDNLRKFWVSRVLVGDVKARMRQEPVRLRTYRQLDRVFAGLPTTDAEIWHR